MILKPTPQERAMKAHDVMLRAMAGELSWVQAADLMGISPRSMRRWRARMERGGADGLLDRRCRRHDVDPVVALEVEQRVVAGDDQIDFGGKGAAEHSIVVRIDRRRRNLRRFDNRGQFRVTEYQLLDRQRRGCDVARKLLAAKDLGEFREQQPSCEEFNAPDPRRVDQLGWWPRVP